MGTVKYTGPVASFHCPTEATIRSLKVHFSPKQNLNGQTKPWPAGGGKNILNMDWFIATNSYISSTGSTGTMAYYSYTDYLELAPNTYTISGINNTVKSNLRIHSYDENKEWVKQLASKYLAEGASFSLTFTVTNDDKYIRISAPAKTPANPYLQLEVGSSATAYVPYENICPIEGWDGVTVHNEADYILLPEEYQRVKWIKSTGTQYINTNILFNHGIKISARMGFAAKENSKTLFGVRIDTGATRFLATYYQGFDFAYWDDKMPFEPEIDHIYDITFDTSVSKKFTYGAGGRLWTVNITEIFPNLTGYIFAYHRGSDDSVQGMSKSYFQSMHIENSSGDVLFNGYACYRKSDNVAGIYDTVAQTFFTNQGTGEFICGPDVGQTTTYEFGVLGKNKLDEQKYADITNYPNQGSYGYKYTDPIILAPNTTYTFSFTPRITDYETIRYWAVKVYDDIYEDINDTGTVKYLVNGTYCVNYSITTGKKGAIRFAVYGGQTTLDEIWDRTTVQLELGSTATTYEPYNPNHTVYGGWVDLISGEVAEEWHKMVINTTSRIGIFPWGGIKTDTITGTEYAIALFWRESTDPKAYTIKDNLCDKLPISTNLNTINTAYVYDGDTYGPAISLPTSIIGTTNETLTEYLTDNPFTFVYKQRVPNTYYLSPIALQTFLGQNNVWSNADYVEVEYDLHETQTILERKAFILANQAKIKTATGAPATFTTTTHAPLKSAKVYFAPVQTGSGTPSPTNVRPILGWKQAGLVINRGKNLINEDALIQNTGIDASGNNRTWDTTKANDFLYLPPGDYILTGTYTGSDASANLRVHGYSHEQNWLKQITYQAKGPNQSYSIPFTMTADMPYMRFSANKDVTNIQLEEGSTASAYEAFSGRELSVNWGGSNGVIYGGYIDLIKGELVQEYDIIVMDGVTEGSYYNTSKKFYGTSSIANTNAYYARFRAARPDNDTSGWICNIAPTFAWDDGDNAKNISSIRFLQFYSTTTSSSTPRLAFPLDSEINTLEKANQFLADMYDAGTPVIYTYPLANPITYSLTPSQLSDFVRTNIVTPYSNSNVEVQYWTH